MNKEDLLELFLNLEKKTDELLWAMAMEGLKNASEAIAVMRPFLFTVIDNTHAGGKHSVDILVHPETQRAYLRIPSEPEDGEGIKGGRFPTICHAIELMSAAYKMASAQFPILDIGMDDDYLMSSDYYSAAQDLHVIVPLTIDPDTTNLMIFHTQVPRIDPEILLRGWYEVIKQDSNLIENPIRHTIMVMPMSSSDTQTNEYFSIDQPLVKTHIYTEVLPKDVVENRARFRPMHLNRVRRWETIDDLNTRSIHRPIQQGGRTIIHVKGGTE